MKEAVTHHSFNVEIASEFGIEEAIILQNIDFWVKKNKADGRNKHDEKYWTYNSAKAFQETFSYMSLYKVKRVLQKLEKEGLVAVANYNRHKYDHTKWYTLTEKAEKLFSASPKNENEEKEEKKEKNTKETLEFQESAKSTNGKEQNQSKEDAKSTDGKFENARTRTVLNTDVKSIVNNNNNDKQKPKKDVVVQKNNLCNQKKKISKKTIEKIKEKTKNLLVKEDILTISKATNCTEEQLIKGVDVLMHTPNVTSAIGFVIKAIKENYDVPKRKENKNNKPKNGFHNFEGSGKDYTNEELMDLIMQKK